MKRWLLVLLGACAASVAAPEPSVPVHSPAPRERPSISGVAGEFVTAFEIHRPNQETIRIARRGEGFVIESPIEEPASTPSVLRALRRLEALRSTRVVTRDPERHRELRVDSTRVVVYAGEEVALDIFVAPYRNAHSKVRRADSDTVFAVHGSVSFPFLRPLRFWRKRELAELDLGAVTEVTLGHAKEIRLVRGAGGWTCAEGCDSRPGSRLDAAGMEQAAGRVAQMVAYDIVSPSDAAAIVFDGFWTRARTSSGVVEVEFSHPRRDSSALDGSFYARRRGEPTVYLMSELTTLDIMLQRPCCTGRTDIMASDFPPDVAHEAWMGISDGAL